MYCWSLYPFNSQKHHQIGLYSTFKSEVLMNIEEYISFVSLSLAQSEQKAQNENNQSLWDNLNMSQQEKFYHYITLKRWMVDYQTNVLESKGKECDCIKSKAKDQFFKQKKQINSLVYEQGALKKIQQINKKIESRQTQCQRLLLMFFEQLRFKIRHNRKEIQRLLRKLKLKTTLQEFKVWVLANLPTSETKQSYQLAKTLLISGKNKQQSLLFRVLLKRYLKNEAYVQIMTLKNSEKMQLKSRVLALRGFEEKIFQRNK